MTRRDSLRGIPPGSPSRRPKPPETEPQEDLFRARLENLADLRHPLVRLAGRSEWGRFETLAAQIAQTERITGIEVERACVDRGYRGHDADHGRPAHLISKLRVLGRDDRIALEQYAGGGAR